MALLDSAGRYSSLRLSGLKASADVKKSLTSVSVSLSATQISEIEFEFLDSPTRSISRGSWLTSGSATATYNGWRFRVSDVDTSDGDAGPMVSVVAQSRHIRDLKSQTGGKNWGTVDYRTWAAERAKSVGMKLIAPKLGRGKMAREKKEKGQDAQSTWDLLVDLAKQKQCLIFEFGSTLVIGSPKWLVSQSYGGKDWNLRYSSATSMSPQLVKAPAVKYGEDSEETYSVEVALLSPDAHLIRPGDTLRISGGRLPYNDKWLITEVDLQVARHEPVVVKAIKPYTLPKQEERSTASSSTSKSSSKTRRPSSSSSATGAKGKTSAKVSASSNSRRAKIEQWGRQYVGRSIDYDGGYGAQCVDAFKMYNAHWVVAPAIRGNGKDNVRNAIASGAYTRVSSPQAGDVVSWGSSWGGGYGHVGVVLKDNGSTLLVWNQLNGTMKIGNLSKRGVVGYARPKRWKR